MVKMGVNSSSFEGQVEVGLGMACMGCEPAITGVVTHLLTLRGPDPRRSLPPDSCRVV